MSIVANRAVKKRNNHHVMELDGVIAAVPLMYVAKPTPQVQMIGMRNVAETENGIGGTKLNREETK